MNHRIFCLDAVRGIAIILIVLGHMELGLMNAGITTNYAFFLNKLIYSIHLPILFVLSGMVERISYRSYNQKFEVLII